MLCSSSDWVVERSWCQQETDLSAFKRGAYVGFGAFGTVNFTGGAGSIGSVGDTTIETTDYARAL